MSLEDALKENTTVLKAFTEALVQCVELIAKNGTKPAPLRMNDEIAAEKAAKKPAPKKAEPQDSDEAAERDEKTINYEKEVRPRIIAFAETHGRPVIEGIFKEFKVKNGTGLKPPQFQKFLDRLDAHENADDSDLG